MQINAGGSSEYLILLYFIYGLSFFTLGIVTFFHLHKFKIYKLDACLFSLGIFGVIHGLHKWIEMFAFIFPVDHFISIYNRPLDIALIVLSLIYLLRFGINVIFARQKYSHYITKTTTIVVLVIAYISFYYFPQNALLYIRYFIGFPASIVATIAFLAWKNYPEIKEINSLKINVNCTILAVFFIIFSIFAGIISPKVNITHTIILILQTICAILIAVCTNNVLVALDIETKKKIDNHRKNKLNKYKKISETDPLTKMQNRLNLQNIISIEIARAHRYKRQLAVLFIDIDDFKDYNDTYGHEEGDKVLVKFSEILHKTLRETDHALRYGGDEFIVLLPETDIEEALRVAERFRNEFKAFKFHPKEHQHFVHKTVSIGIATYRDGTSATELIQQADKEMYKAKKHGKNQTHVLE